MPRRWLLLRLWFAVVLALASGLLVSVGVTTAHWYWGQPVVEAATR